MLLIQTVCRGGKRRRRATKFTLDLFLVGKFRGNINSETPYFLNSRK